MRCSSVALILAVSILAGCLDDGGDPDELNSQIPDLLPAILNDAGSISVEVPVDVFMVGFPESTAAAVREDLTDEAIEHGVYGFSRNLLGPDGATAGFMPNPVQPMAKYRVHAVPLGNLTSQLDQVRVDSYYDANAAEEALVQLLTDAGFALDANRPALVLLHLGDKGHGYRIMYETGHVDRVRAFGERTHLLVLDVSAAVDPWVGSQLSYQSPVGFDNKDALVEAVRAATHFRLLQGPLYPPALAPCHAVTLLTVVRAASLTEVLPGYTRAEDLVQPDNLVQAWEALLGDGRVHVDPAFLELPSGDPGLDLILRTGDLDALRYWMDENWDTYWVPHDGCEAYVSIFLVGDVADSGVSGIAMYDVRDDRRLSLSSLNDQARMREEGTGMGAPIFYVPDDSRYETDWLDFLYTHETGHLFSMRHPHDITILGTGGFNPTFSSIWSAMSYQEDGKLPQFGVVDQTNYARNRAGFLLQELAGTDPDHPAIQSALGHMGQFHWRAAGAVLEEALEV